MSLNGQLLISIKTPKLDYMCDILRNNTLDLTQGTVLAHPRQWTGMSAEALRETYERDDTGR